MISRIGIYTILSFIVGQCLAYQKADTFSQNTSGYKMRPIHIKTRWASEVTDKNSLKEYPRPQMERKNWINLNGLWEYAITDSSIGFPMKYDGNILVPFPIESALSGVQKKLLPAQRLWYKRNIQCPIFGAGDRILLNFEAIDWQATVYINKVKLTDHTGGYQHFSVDITNSLKPGINEIIVSVVDPSDHGLNPHGKQVLNPSNIYYTASSGIWQTVWLEKVATTHVKHLKILSDIDNNTLTIQINATEPNKDFILEVNAVANGETISNKRIQLSDSETYKLNLSIPNPRLWSPDDPFLYDLSVKLIRGIKTVDEVKSYFGMRKINIEKDEKGVDRIFLNNKYTFNLGVLDQGFWPDGLYTAPTDEALAFDIKVIKAMGFNTIRKHIKIEPERWYYHADKIGLLVWQDFVNPPQALPEGSKPIFEKEVKETIDQIFNHPSIVTWVVFNERWGSYDQQRITKWIKDYDPTRIINGHSGELLYVNNELREPSDSPWISSDITDVHSYPEPRNPPGLPGKAKVLGEFGGMGVAVPGHEWDDMQGWGYVQVTSTELKAKYKNLNKSLKKLEFEGLSGSIYTQPFDVEGEENGLLSYDREIIKIPINEIRNINKDLVIQSNGFRLDSNFVIAANISEDDNDNRYLEMLEQYNKGLRDSFFLRRLTLLSLRKRDQLTATKIGNDYIEMLTEPFSEENLIFISKITNTSKDKGFELFSTHSEEINAVIGRIFAEYRVKGILNKEILDPYLVDSNKAPAWDSIQQQFKIRFGQLGEELIIGKRMMYYHDVKQDWLNYGKYYVLYYKKALKRPEYITNNLSWSVFQHVDDPDVLEFALTVMKYDLETWDQAEPQAYDTYANLLHKLNRSNEAIKWEEKALQLKRNAEEEKVFAETLQKMKAGLPTWPQNN